jgi:hypothetical protein
MAITANLIKRHDAPNSPNTSGVLTINDHDGHVAHIKLDRYLCCSRLPSANDGGGRTLLTDPIDSAPHTIADGATLEIANSASGKITFAGAAETLQLDSPCGFSGTVAGFGGQDQIDLTVSALARTPRSAIPKTAVLALS